MLTTFVQAQTGIYVKVGIGTTSPYNPLHIVAPALSSPGSTEKYAINIAQGTGVLSLITKNTYFKYFII